MRPVRIHHEYRKEGRTIRGKNSYYVNRNKQAIKHCRKGFEQLESLAQPFVQLVHEFLIFLLLLLQ